MEIHFGNQTISVDTNNFLLTSSIAMKVEKLLFLNSLHFSRCRSIFFFSLILRMRIEAFKYLVESAR